ncbi:fibronectin type III domain-containing protein [Ohtaekwangia koreensis]|uniref:fibronectin type III domain-containing protein n=1 Tax=Ohtaekwangia koreensis TaxID=688867 RepID=UPI0009A60766|nr:DNA/RNA non-specific endonuclease [Ohtaekwangia koreensis]
MKSLKSILFFLFLFVGKISFAQVYPVQATVQLTPPYSLYLSDYVESGTERLALNIFLADIARPQLDVRFRLRIVGQGVTIETKPEYRPAPISIQGGVSQRLISTDLADYFNSNNLNFQGISRREYDQRGKLPEGVYQFCFEVLEYNRGAKISNTACGTAWMILNDPPIVNLPRQNEKLKVQTPQNVLLQWTPRHTGSPNSAFTTSYDVTMVEVWPSTRNPNDAILTSPPIFETTTSSTTVVYGPAETPLEPGRRYAFRVRARSISGVDELDLFKNNGYSEVISFVYGDACDLPTGINAGSIGTSKFSLTWDGLFNHTAYKVRYRETGTTNWYENSVTSTNADIYSLKPGTVYEYQVAATCGFYDGQYSAVSKITTNPLPEAEYACGAPIGTFNIDPKELTGSLKAGDIIQAGDFDVKLTKVTGSNGIFSGEGVIEVPYFNKAKVKTSFADITVSKELRMVNGYMNVTGAAVDIIPSGVLDAMNDLTEVLNAADSALNTIEENLPEQFDPNSFVADTAITVKEGISSVYKDDDGTVVIVDSKGTETRLPVGTSAAIKDDNGKGYLVDKKGNVHKVTADVAAKAGNREYNLTLKFAANGRMQYGFDERKHDAIGKDYEQLKNYSVAWKSVASGGVTDVVTALLSGTGIDNSKIKFEQSGIVLQAQPFANNQTTLSVRGGSDGTEEGLLAVYSASDTGKVQVLGKLNVVSYNKISNSVVIVPVNNTTLPSGLTAQIIEDSLNAIYKQAVVDWKVSIAAPITVTGLGDPFDDGDSELLSNYTSDMKSVIKAFGNLQDETLYLFLVSNPQSSNGLGYMPRGKQVGFIFVDHHGSDKVALVRTMAHELGHGTFSLHHTFKEPNFTLTRGATDNLMDYPNGNKLYKYQWDKMRYPDIVVGLFEEDEEGKSVIATLSSNLSINGKGEYFAYLTPAGSRIILPKDKYPIFFHGIANDSYNEVIPGTLIGFKDSPNVGEPVFSGEQHWADFSGGTFNGYKNYTYQKPAVDQDDNSIVIGLPSVREGNNFAIYKFTVASPKDFNNQATPILSITSSEFESLGLFGKNQPDAKATNYRDGAGLVGDEQIQISLFEQEMIRGKYIDVKQFLGFTTLLQGLTNIPHDEKPEIFLIVKLAEYQNRYSVFFKEYASWFDMWDVLAITKKLAAGAKVVLPDEAVDKISDAFGVGGTWEIENITTQTVANEGSEYNKWSKNISEHNAVLYSFYRNFLIGLQRSTADAAKQNIECLKSLSSNKSDQEIYDCVIRASQDELQQTGILSDADRLFAIKSLLSHFWVDGKTEEAIVKLIKYTPSTFDADKFITALETECEVRVRTFSGDEYGSSKLTYEETICLWEVLFTSVDDSKFLFSGDSRNVLMLALLKQYYRSKKFQSQMTEYKASLEGFKLDEIDKRQYAFQYDYQGIFRRLWSDIKQGASPFIIDTDDYYVTINTTIQNVDTKGSPSTIKINQDIQKGVVSSATVASETLSPFDLTIFTNKSNQDLLRDYSQKDKDGKLLAIPVPALTLHYASVVGDNQTAGQLIQTGIDVGTLLIPGAQLAQLSKLGKVLYYADKISSVASMAGTAFEVEDPELAKVFNLASIATGVASLAEITQASKVGTIKKADNLLNNTTEQIVSNSVNLANEINNLKGTEKLYELTLRQAEGLRTMLDKDQQVLSQMGHLDEAQRLKIKNAVNVLGDVVSKKGILSSSNILDDVLTLGEDLSNAASWLGKNSNDGFFDVIIHASSGNTFSILMEGGQSITISAAELANRLESVDARKTIRLLSCNDAESALELSKILGRDVVGSVGEMRLYDNGFIETGSWYKAKPDGLLDEYPLIPTHDPLLKTSNKSIVLGKSRKLSNRLTREVNDDLLRMFSPARYNEFIQHIDRLPSTMSIKRNASGALELIDKDGNVWAKIFSDRIEAVGGIGNGWNKLININPPLLKDFKYIVDNNFIYETDNLGRVSLITIEDVSINPRVRNETAQAHAKNVKDGKATDAGGHMAKSEWNGPSEQINYFPQDPASNSYGEWYKMEGEITKLKLDNPNSKIKVEIYPAFAGTQRPTEFTVIVSKDGTFHKDFDIKNP